MAIILKCKMCGGDLALTEGSTIATCEYCGITQTVPNQDNEKKLTLFARANRLRAACEFDKAAGIYETIVTDFPEEAEAYWGLVLCKFGIEYVDDPATGKKIPTCHRSSFDSVREDSNLGLTIEYADAVSRKIYQEEAKQIEELRKGIIEVSSKEDPYDIFICYKETDENGDRTLDSVLAQDVYDALTDKGYRVFFSRITLEEKLGQEYEPYIFAALNSAKVMLAVGTSFDHYNAVWVKNEWSRFLKLIEKDKSKHLIPCYKGIDAYDMPKEFARLQAQDLGKVGGLQDLLRGIEKLISFTRKSPATQSDSGADEIANTVTYRTALDTARKGTIKDLQDAIAQLKTISGWKDTDQQIQELEKKLAKQKKKKTIKNVIIVATVLAVIIGFWLLWTTPGPAVEAPAMEAPAVEAPAAPAEEPQPAMSDADMEMVLTLLGGDMNNYVTYAPEGAEKLGLSSGFDGAIEWTATGLPDDQVMANLDKDLVLQIHWEGTGDFGYWDLYTILHEAYGIDPTETWMKSIFGAADMFNNPRGTNVPYGFVRIQDGMLYFYDWNEETEAMVAAGALSVAEPVFYGEIKDDGTDVWLGLSCPELSTTYKMLSK